MSIMAMSSWEFPPSVPAINTNAAWHSDYWLTMLLMWWIMMIAMMIPSAAPMILLFARVHRHHRAQAQKKASTPVQHVAVPTGAFLAGYLLAWLAFSLAATALQWLLERAGLLHSMLMWSTSHLLSASFLLAAGAYQLSPLKGACLVHCRSPIAFISRHWRNGRWGALRMGVAHGLYCVGCCWTLMALLFVGGVMNLVWIAGLAIFVLLEKLAPSGMWVAHASGFMMLAAGGGLLLF